MTTTTRTAEQKLSESMVDFTEFQETCQWRTLLKVLANDELTVGELFFVFTAGREDGLAAAAKAADQ